MRKPKTHKKIRHSSNLDPISLLHVSIGSVIFVIQLA